jgi:hypothetical protein
VFLHKKANEQKRLVQKLQLLVQGPHHELEADLNSNYSILEQ